MQNCTPPLACIDIGSNSVLLLVANVTPDRFVTPILEECRITGLGQGVGKSGVLAPKAVSRTLDAVRDFVEAATRAGAEQITATGSSALRDADNAEEFIAAVKKLVGSEPIIVSGHLEAALSFESLFTDSALDTSFPLAMADIGGGSTEIVVASSMSNFAAKSLNIGALRLTERFLHSDPYKPVEITRAAELVQDTLTAEAPTQSTSRLVLIGGTAVALACIAYPQQDHRTVHACYLDAGQISSQIGALSAVSLAERELTPGLPQGRAKTIVAGAIIVSRLLAHFALDRAQISVRGLRYGVIARMSRGNWGQH